MILDLEERIQQEQLPDGVDYVYDLDKHVARYEIVAVKLPSNQTTCLRDEMLDAHYAAGAILPLRQQVAIHLVDHVAYRLLADFQVGRLGADARGIHDSGHVDPGALVQEPPEEARYEGEKRLEEKDQRYPLVVADQARVVLLRNGLTGYHLLHG